MKAKSAGETLCPGVTGRSGRKPDRSSAGTVECLELHLPGVVSGTQGWTLSPVRQKKIERGFLLPDGEQ